MEASELSAIPSAAAIASAPAQAQVVAVVKKEDLGYKSRVQSVINASMRRATVVDYFVRGGGGHPDLYPIILSKSNMTHSVFERLCAPQEDNGKMKPAVIEDHTPGLHYVGSDCYAIPANLASREDSSTNGGRSGVVCWHYSKIRTKPGSYMLLAASEMVCKRFLKNLLDRVSIRVGSTSKTGHVLTIEHVRDLISNPSEPIDNIAATFFKEWVADVTYHQMQKKDKTGKLKTTLRWNPLAIKWPRAGAGLGLSPDDEHVLSKIIEYRSETRKLKGQQLYERMVAEGKLYTKSTRLIDELRDELKLAVSVEEKADLEKRIDALSRGMAASSPRRAAKEAEATRAKAEKKGLANISAEKKKLQKAEKRLEKQELELKKELRDAEKGKKPATPKKAAADVAKIEEQKDAAAEELKNFIAQEREEDGDSADGKVKVEDPAFKIDSYLSQPKYASKLMVEVYGARSPISKIKKEVHRFFDDFFNRVLVTLAGMSVRIMLVTDSVSLSEKVAMAAVEDFFCTVSLGAQSEVQRNAVQSASEMAQTITSDLARKKELAVKRKSLL